jgi:hypothetical protein
MIWLNLKVRFYKWWKWIKSRDSTGGRSELGQKILQWLRVNHRRKFYTDQEWITEEDSTLARVNYGHGYYIITWLSSETVILHMISELYRVILQKCQANQMKRLYIDKDWANQKILQGEQRIRERDFTQNWMNQGIRFYTQYEWIMTADFSTK